jgi:hypothetical protein
MPETVTHIPYLWPIVAIALAFAASIAGGAISGMLIGGKSLGNELAAMMGVLYGPLAGVPGALLAVIILMLFGWSA